MALERPSAGEALRRFTLGSGPLKRGSDRLQVLARVLLLCTLLVAVPIALAVATSTGSRARIQAAAQVAERHQVSARLLEDAPWTSAGADDVAARSPAQAVWTGPSGIEQEVLVLVPAGSPAGTTVGLWADRDGRLAQEPLSEGDIVASSVGHALLTLFLIATSAVAAYLSLRKLLDRGRSRRWAAEWVVVEPVWTRRPC
jgi:hypothetical protein